MNYNKVLNHSKAHEDIESHSLISKKSVRIIFKYLYCCKATMGDLTGDTAKDTIDRVPAWRKSPVLAIMALGMSAPILSAGLYRSAPIAGNGVFALTQFLLHLFLIYFIWVEVLGLELSALLPRQQTWPLPLRVGMYLGALLAFLWVVLGHVLGFDVLAGKQLVSIGFLALSLLGALWHALLYAIGIGLASIGAYQLLARHLDWYEAVLVSAGLYAIGSGIADLMLIPHLGVIIIASSILSFLLMSCTLFIHHKHGLLAGIGFLFAFELGILARDALFHVAHHRITYSLILAYACVLLVCAIARVWNPRVRSKMTIRTVHKKRLTGKRVKNASKARKRSRKQT